jgi:acyl-coenzyme A thioesterase PaaI-like protein
VGVETYLELGDDVGRTEEGRLLKGEHGVFALHGGVSLSACRHVSCGSSVTHVERRKLGAVRVEGLVVVLGELLCKCEVSMSQAEDQERVGAYGRSR